MNTLIWINIISTHLTLARCLCLSALAALGVLGANPLFAEDGLDDFYKLEENKDAADPAPRWYFNFGLGYQQWSALGDLNAGELGSFDDTGWNLNGAVHRRWRDLGGGELLLGGDLGWMSFESNITAPGDLGQLDADVYYLTPSVKWAFEDRKQRRYNLEAGAGLYWAEIKEFYSFGYTLQPGTSHWDDTAPGGYVGVSADWPVGDTGRWAVNTALRAHFVDFGQVEALGTELGSLDGAITTLQVGFTFKN